MDARAGSIIKQSSRWIAAALAPIGVGLPLWYDMDKRHDEVEKELIRIKDRVEINTRTLESIVVDMRNRIAVDGTGFAPGAIRNALDLTIRQHIKDLVDKAEFERKLHDFAVRNSLKE